MCALISLKIQIAGNVVEVNAELYANKNQANIFFGEPKLCPIISPRDPVYHSRGWLGPVCSSSWWGRKMSNYLPSSVSTRRETGHSSQPTSLCLQQKSPSPQTTQMIISTLRFTVAVKIGFCLECASPLVLATRLFLSPGVNRPTLRLNFWIWEQCGGRGTWLSVVLPTGLPSRSPRLMPTMSELPSHSACCDNQPMWHVSRLSSHVKYCMCSPGDELSYTATFKCYFTDFPKAPSIYSLIKSDLVSTQSVTERSHFSMHVGTNCILFTWQSAAWRRRVQVGMLDCDLWDKCNNWATNLPVQM